MDSIAAEYGGKGTVCLAIQWIVEDTLVTDGTFALPGKKVLERKSDSIKYIVVDVTESPINRLKEGEKALQVIIEGNTREILDAQEAKGSEHDFKVYKESIGSSVNNSIPLDADRGYLGIEEYHRNNFIPVKSSKGHQLSEGEETCRETGSD
jgi:hypothetical protein